MKTRYFLIEYAFAALLAGVSCGGIHAASDSEPPPPPWVNPDGSVDMSKYPERVAVAGPDGQKTGGYVYSSDDFGGPSPQEAREILAAGRHPYVVVRDENGNIIGCMDMQGFAGEEKLVERGFTFRFSATSGNVWCEKPKSDAVEERYGGAQ